MNEYYCVAGILIVVIVVAYYIFYKEGLDNTKYLNTSDAATLLSKTDSILVARAERTSFTDQFGKDITRLVVHANLFNFQDPNTEQYLVIGHNGNEQAILGDLKKGDSGYWILVVNEDLATTKLNSYCSISIVYSNNGVQEEILTGDFY